uniref:Putative structural protein n=1 Tax=Vesanto virus TaxID=1955786 RepID=A0A7D5AMA5_9VIRU|nr:putative structural protein [Vesanto virus]
MDKKQLYCALLFVLANTSNKIAVVAEHNTGTNIISKDGEGTAVAAVKVESRADPIFERDVLQTVEETLNSLGDFSSLNDNYMMHEQLTKKMNTELASLEVPGLAFDMQSAGTFQELPENAVLVALQVTYGLWDVEEGVNKIGGMTITRTEEFDGSEVLEVEVLDDKFKCVAFALNIVNVADSVSNGYYEVVWGKNFASIQEGRAIESSRRELTALEALKLLLILTEVPEDKFRMKVDEDRGVEFDAQQTAIMIEQSMDWLEYTAYSYIFRYMYSLLDMNREQLLSNENIDIETRAGIVPNVFYLNQQVYQLQKAVEEMPYVLSLGWSDFSEVAQEVLVTQQDKENCLETKEMLYSSFIPSKEGTFTPGKAFESMSYAISLVVASGVVARTSIELSCEWKTWKNTLHIKEEGWMGYLNSSGTYQCNLNLASTMDLLFDGATGLPYDVNTLSIIALDTILENKVVRTEFGSPIAISIEQVGYVAYGLRYVQIARNTSSSLPEETYTLTLNGSLISTSFDLCSKDCWIIYDNQVKMRGFEHWLPFFEKLVRPLLLNGITIKWNYDLETIAVARSGLGNSRIQVQLSDDGVRQLEVIARAQVARRGDGLPFSQSNSLNVLAYQLNALSNEVADITERVQKLEDAVYQTSRSIWSFIQRGLNIVDIAFNVVELGKFGAQFSKSAFATMKRNSKTDKNPLAQQFKQKTADSDKLSGSYSVISGIENAAQVSNLQGHSKNYFYNSAASKIEPQDISLHTIAKNKQDTREVMELNAAVYSKVQMEVFNSLTKENTQWRDFSTAPFGVVSVHKSPIDVPIAQPASKFLSAKYSGTQSGRAFLSNEQQTFPFHTSVSSSAIEIRTDDKIVLNTRFTGVAEPSIIGPTNAKNPRVKVGYVKIQHEVIIINEHTSTLRLLPWHNTEIKPGVFYSQSDVDQLYKSFFPKSKDTLLTTDQKWELVAHQTSKRINTRDKIDYVPVQSNIFLGSLDDMMFFSQSGGRFKYNLLNNNCQTYARAFAQMAAYGSTNMDILVSDFRAFSMRVADFARDYFANSPAMQQISSFAASVPSLLGFLRDFFTPLIVH